MSKRVKNSSVAVHVILTFLTGGLWLIILLIKLILKGLK